MPKKSACVSNNPSILQVKIEPFKVLYYTIYSLVSFLQQIKLKFSITMPKNGRHVSARILLQDKLSFIHLQCNVLLHRHWHHWHWRQENSFFLLWWINLFKLQQAKSDSTLSNWISETQISNHFLAIANIPLYVLL